MGLILIICLWLDLAVIFLINLLAFFLLNYFKTRIVKVDSFINVKVGLVAIPLLVISITGSTLIFKIFYNEFGSYLWLPIINNEIKIAETEYGNLVLEEEVDRVTGARGGINLKLTLYLVSNNEKKEIEFTTNNIYYVPPNSFILEDRRKDKNRKHPKQQLYNLYLNPKEFTPNEFNAIGKTISQHILEIDKKLNIPREPLKFFEARYGRIPHISKIAYLDRNILPKKYTCGDGTIISINDQGYTIITFYDYVQLKNGHKFRECSLGNLTENGTHMLIRSGIENYKFDQKNEKLELFTTIISSCYNAEKTDFLEEYEFSQDKTKNGN